MKLGEIAEIRPGYLNRHKIEPVESGSHLLVQARDVEAGILACDSVDLIRFNPDHSSRDILLRDGDVVFMSRGVRNYAALLTEVPSNTLVAASFFVVRVSGRELAPGYLAWYLNQPRAQHHFSQNSGRGVHMPVVRRSVLESLDVPVPPLATQEKIATLFQLSLNEHELTTALLEKRAKLMEAVCLQAAEREGS